MWEQPVLNILNKCSLSLGSPCYGRIVWMQVFKNNIEKRIRSLPEIDGLSKETVLSSWMAKFDQIFRGDDDPRKRPQRQSAATSEMILTKEQLYDMFQNILSIKKYEHQILYNAMQVIIVHSVDDAWLDEKFRSWR